MESSWNLNTLAAIHLISGNRIERRSGALNEAVNRAQGQHVIGLAAYHRFQSSMDTGDINEAIDCWELAVALTPNWHADQLSRLSNLGTAYRLRYERTGELADLGRSIHCGTMAILLTPDGHPDKPAILNNLGNAYRARFARVNNVRDITTAVKCGAQSVSLTHTEHPDRPVRLSNLGLSHQLRFERLGELVDLNEAVKLGGEAASLISDGNPDKPATLSNLGISYQTRFACQGSILDLNNAIECTSQAVSLTPVGQPDHAAMLNNLGNSLRARFACSANVSDLDESIKCGVQALASTPGDHPDKLGRLSNLGNSYQSRFELLGEMADLEKTIEYGTQTLPFIPHDHPDRSSALSNLGNSYQARFERLGDITDISQAIELAAEAVSLTPDKQPDKPGRLSNLGSSYRIRFECLGDVSDLVKSIECGVLSVALISDSNQGNPAPHYMLGVSYLARFEHLGEISDLNEAIKFITHAVTLAPDDYMDKPTALNSLGNSYQARFLRLGDIIDINKAVEYGLEAVSLTPEGHLSKPMRLNSLGNSYQTRFRQAGEFLDLNEAVSCGTQAVSLTPNDHPGKPGRLSNLGNSYSMRFQSLGEISDINDAINCGTQAVLLTPDGHPAKLKRLYNLGLASRARFEHAGNISDLQFAVSCFRSAAESPSGPPSQRFRACRQWIQLTSCDSMSPLPAYQFAMNLLPQLIWIGTTVERRYELVAEVGEFATEAASHAITCKTYGLALEWLEAGRSVIWGQIAQLRTPFDKLLTWDPQLAHKLLDIGCRLELASSQSSYRLELEAAGRPLSEEANIRIQLAINWERLLAEARSAPGFEDFLSPTKSSQLLRAATSHPIVVVNSSHSRCDALILHPGSNHILHCPLPEFSAKNAAVAREDLTMLAGPRAGGFKKASGLNPTGDALGTFKSLPVLWLSVVKPVLDLLGYTHRPLVEPLPRITWCTTGILSFLPLHAAGCYDMSGCNTFEHVISSYTPTLSSLLTHHSRDPAACHGVLVVGQVHTPGFSMLPCIDDELKIIQCHVRAHPHLRLEGSQATIKQVLDAMEHFGWVHLACHGTQNMAESTQSAFHLHDGPLTLAMITKRSFSNKGLAFLSACQTATGDDKMPDEAVHLAAGMLMAGYPSIIGTMWGMADEDGPGVSNRVYAELLQDGKMDHTKAARALHRAVAHLRAKVGERDVARWAPFIHVGC